jgi:hypothetical protein
MIDRLNTIVSNQFEKLSSLYRWNLELKSQIVFYFLLTISFSYNVCLIDKFFCSGGTDRSLHRQGRGHEARGPTGCLEVDVST